MEDIKSIIICNWKKVAQNRDSWKKVVQQARTLYIYKKTEKKKKKRNKEGGEKNKTKTYGDNANVF